MKYVQDILSAPATPLNLDLKRLKKLGYEPLRQTGSHIMLTTQVHGVHYFSTQL